MASLYHLLQNQIQISKVCVCLPHDSSKFYVCVCLGVCMFVQVLPHMTFSPAGGVCVLGGGVGGHASVAPLHIFYLQMEKTMITALVIVLLQMSKVCVFKCCPT